MVVRRNQIRKAGTAIQSNHLIWNGWTAGRFCIAYVLVSSWTRQRLLAGLARSVQGAERL